MWRARINWTTTGGLLTGSVEAQSEPVADAAGVGEDNALSKAYQLLSVEFMRLSTSGSGSIDLSALGVSTEEV